ncbi:hypothetical protein [Mahella australiensis]|uniref:Uncharacterized protein n=1 Tax=Mahella australiensis (strain DSM 15567 / CIP 107919 / 50-1 BON) TaxID=697281 RepID=F3ZZE0_MAHA5|nr:hypothetical protein [Mahella australiensis]AEE95750.1 hypothetical protein Mahau_0546 [Mahella australiensis 50-1 BON]
MRTMSLIEAGMLTLIKEGFIILGIVMAGMLLNLKLWIFYIVGTVVIVAAEIIFVYPHDIFAGLLVGLVMGFIACFIYVLYQ